MLSIKGIYDGEKIIPKEPIDLKGGKFEVIITFLEPIKELGDIKISNFCGVWEDERSAEEIVEDIYKQRENFELREVKL